jgi:hypothetical protein
MLHAHARPPNSAVGVTSGCSTIGLNCQFRAGRRRRRPSPDRLLHSNGFGEVSGLVYVAAAANGDMVGEQLEGDYFEDGQE